MKQVNGDIRYLPGPGQWTKDSATLSDDGIWCPCCDILLSRRSLESNSRCTVLSNQFQVSPLTYSTDEATSESVHPMLCVRKRLPAILLAHTTLWLRSHWQHSKESSFTTNKKFRVVGCSSADKKGAGESGTVLTPSTCVAKGCKYGRRLYWKDFFVK